METLIQCLIHMSNILGGGGASQLSTALMARQESWVIKITIYLNAELNTHACTHTHARTHASTQTFEKKSVWVSQI